MFKHVLIPTDGTTLSQKTVGAGIELAKSLGARVTGFYAAEEYPVPPFGEYVPPDLLSPEEFRANEEVRARKILDVVEAAAKEASVVCDTKYEFGFAPWEAIVRAAKQNGCDLIFMASHGRRGLASILLGSETNRVLTHSTVPVLVYRSPKPAR
ncbi:MAG: universal stress protein [Burkholderiales bacterium]|nr:universal stress protein [Burkholderiales bacterium]